MSNREPADRDSICPLGPETELPYGSAAGRARVA